MSKGYKSSPFQHERETQRVNWAEMTRERLSYGKDAGSLWDIYKEQVDSKRPIKIEYDPGKDITYMTLVNKYGKEEELEIEYKLYRV